jgi:BREX system ATP-binding protein BrxC/D/SAP domain
MRVVDLLAHYPDEDLDRLARDKVDEITNLRLPREVLIQEIAVALSTLSYVAKVLAPARPPTYAILRHLMEAPDRKVMPQGFRQSVQALTDDMTAQAESGEGLSKDKQYTLYLRMLFAAWEDDGRVDRSEALLLAALRKELGIWTREHLLLEHHPMVRPIWDSERAYTDARNHLLATGLVLVHEGGYVLPEEVETQIRRAWGIDLADDAYRRLLDKLSGNQLRTALNAASLPLSGAKDARIERLVKALVPPAEVLDALHINEVKELCRGVGLPVSAAKADLIDNVVRLFDSGLGLAPESAPATPVPVMTDPEARELDAAAFRRLLDKLTVDLLYDMLAARSLHRAGSKSDRIEHLLSSPWSERTLLAGLRRVDLVDLCRRLGVRVSGVKNELVDRLLEWAAEPEPVEAVGDDADRGQPSPPTMSVQRLESEGQQASSAREPGEAASAEAIQPPEPRPPQPPLDLDLLRERFASLEPDELVVLALLRQARSLNEQEIERAARHHQLGWFLIKAHMAELIGRLRGVGATPIRVRSTGGYNIYEWIGDHDDTTARLDQRAARDVIDALRQGVVPERHLDLLAVGQDVARQHLVSLLDQASEGRSVFKFLRGPYGAGKTFLCAWLREQALRTGFAVSTVRIGADQHLSDLPVFFSALVDGMRTPEKRDASALADLLESRLLALHRQTAAEHHMVAFDPAKREELAVFVERRLADELAVLANLDPGFGQALKAFYRARVSGDQASAVAALSWIRGSRALPAAVLSAIGVRGHLTPEEVFPRVRALLEVVAGGHLRGLLLIVDEVELVRRFPHARQRERAYETLRLLIDECGENRLPACLLMCTGTDQLFEDERFGLPSYRALLQRVSSPQPLAGPPSVRQPILRLDPLDRDRLLQVALRVREIHGLAYGWNAEERVPLAVLERRVDDCTLFGEGQTGRLPRPFLRDTVHLLDLCEEQPEVAAEDLLPTAVGDLSATAESVLHALES